MFQPVLGAFSTAAIQASQLLSSVLSICRPVAKGGLGVAAPCARHQPLVSSYGASLVQTFHIFARVLAKRPLSQHWL